MRGETDIFLCKLFKLTEGSLKRQTCHILYDLGWYLFDPSAPISVLNWFIILTGTLFLTNLSSKLSSSLLSKLEKFSEVAWHNPRPFGEYKAVDYRSWIPLLLLSTFILRHCCQTLKKYVCVQYNRWKLSVD